LKRRKATKFLSNCRRLLAKARSLRLFVFGIQGIMIDRFFDQPTLKKMGEDVASGHPPTLAPETRENLINLLRTRRV